LDDAKELADVIIGLDNPLGNSECEAKPEWTEAITHDDPAEETDAVSRKLDMLTCADA
jgi:hypothetical protein